ncbi:MAG: hypothetical protein QXY83_06205, partial [Thermosphaera sp.]
PTRAKGENLYHYVRYLCLSRAPAAAPKPREPRGHKIVPLRVLSCKKKGAAARSHSCGVRRLYAP